MLSALGCGCSQNEAEVNVISRQPLRLKPVGRFSFPCSPEDATWCRQQMVPRHEGFNQGQCLHMLYLHGASTTFPDSRIATGQDLLDLILDGEKGKSHFGQPCFVASRFGLRVPDDSRVSKADEAHRDQTIALLGHLGMSADTVISTDTGTGTLGDAIRDSIATFDLKSSELEWTAWAYSMYLTGSRGWVNRFGESFTFDMLVEALMSRSLPSASCGGTHVLLSLTLILRADLQQPRLSPDVRRDLHAFLEKAVFEAVGNQQHDGSWKIDWHQFFLPSSSTVVSKDSARERLIATGHIAEWLLHVPDVLQPPEELYRRAAIWLMAELRRREQEQVELFCPYTHGLFVVIRGSEAVLQGNF